ncbi:MAG: response regulator [Opitutales bacterium]|nr:response regulator [Opitutales bacterium]
MRLFPNLFHNPTASKVMRSQLDDELTKEFHTQFRFGTLTGLISVVALGLIMLPVQEKPLFEFLFVILALLYMGRMYLVYRTGKLSPEAMLARPFLYAAYTLMMFVSVTWATLAYNYLYGPDEYLNFPFLLLFMGVMTLTPSIVSSKPAIGIAYSIPMALGIFLAFCNHGRDNFVNSLSMVLILTVMAYSLGYQHYVRLKHGIILGLEKDSLYGRLLQAKERAESSANAKSAFLATMSHEIRTPVNGLMGMLEILRETELNSTQVNYLNTASRSAESLLQLLNDILDYSKIEVGRLELERVPFDWIAMTGEIALMNRVLAADRGIAFHLDIPPEGTSIVLGDPTRLRQILNNLLSNALKFTHEGSVTLKVAIENESSDKILLRISVKDTGIGISQEAQDKLFQHYQQATSSTARNYGGTGLGLAISQQLAHLMGGNIRCVSELGAGSEFILSVPFQKASADALKSIVSTNGARQERFRARVLIVEDDPVSQRVAVLMLKSFGVIPTVVNSGAAAIDAEAMEDFDIVFTDLRLPDMSGFDVASAIRRRGMEQESQDVLRTFPAVIAMTGVDTPEDRRLAVTSGIVDFLCKPVRKRDIRLCLERWAGQKLRDPSRN